MIGAKGAFSVSAFEWYPRSGTGGHSSFSILILAVKRAVRTKERTPSGRITTCGLGDWYREREVRT